MKFPFTKRINNDGMTIVELMVVMSVTALFTSLILYFGFNYWRTSSAAESDLTAFVSRLNAQDYVREIVGTSSGLITQNSIPDPNALKPDPVAGANYWLPLHAVPQTVPVGGDGEITPLLYFRRISIKTDNTIAMNGAQPYEDQYVLYLNGTSKELLVRTLANPDVSGNKAQTTCPPDVATNTCPADKVILGDLSSIETSYYSRSGNNINYESIIDPNTLEYIGPDFPLVEALQFTFNINAKPLFQKSDTTISATIVRIALRNL